MVDINEFRAFCEWIAKNVVKTETYIMAVQEEQVRKKLQNKTGKILVGVYPSVDTEGVEDNNYDVDTVLLYVLSYSGKNNLTEKDELDDYSLMQMYVREIKNTIIYYAGAGCGFEFLRGLKYDSFHIEPEWNVAGSYNGYSISFAF